MLENKIVKVNGVGVSSEVPELTPEQKKQLEKLTGGLLPVTRPVPVPMRNQNLYSEQEMVNLSMGRKGYLDIMAKRYKDKPSRISTGIPELDEVTGGGWYANGLSVITAMPNIGKTTILLQSAVKMAQQGYVVVYVTCDMRKADLEPKIISQISYSLIGDKCLTIKDITNENALSNDTDHIRDIADKLESTMQYLHIRDLISDEDFDTGCDKDITLSDKSRIERVFEKYTTAYEKVIFIIDSLQQVASYTDTGKNGVDIALRRFKEMSATAPIVMVSTLNRGGYEKEQGEINFKDLKETGALEYNADLIVTMVPMGFVVKGKNESLKDFKSKAYRDIMITCKKSRDSSEKDKAMTLFAPGCTFIHYEGKDTPDNQGNKDTEDTKTPPPESVDWGMVS